MTQYTLNPSRYPDGPTLQLAVGQQYHLGLSDGNVFYGYLLEPDNSKSGGFLQRSDTTTKDALIQYSSPNLIDRDLAFFPRVTDGDFSGGGYQEVYINPKQYFDSDLDPHIPGYLQLRPAWIRKNVTNVTFGPFQQTVSWNNHYWFTLGESNKHVYTEAATVTLTIVARFLDTDGTYLFYTDGTQVYRRDVFGAQTQVASSVNGGTIQQIWVVRQGTNGYFLYYLGGDGNLYKIDLTASFPVAPGSQPQVPLGSNPFNVVDLVPFGNGIAILTNDSGVSGNPTTGFDVWNSDGTNLTRIARVEGYLASGLCNCLGNLYVSASLPSQLSGALLFEISGGTVSVVVRPSNPLGNTSPAEFGFQPRTAGQYVYWPLRFPSVNGISGANVGVVVQYDTLTGAATHLPVSASNDFNSIPTSTVRTLSVIGTSVGAVFFSGSTGILQYQSGAFTANPTFSPSGWMVSSLIDFTTPGISKRFRRVEVRHSALNVGESILVEVFIDTDPLTFTTSLTPAASVTNTVAGSTLTILPLGEDTIGRTLFFALQIVAAAGQATTPRVNNVSVEIGGTWAWELNLACTSKRQLLDGQNEDTQGVTGKDLAYLLLLSYENGNNLTLFHRNGQSYTVTIESLRLWNPSPMLAWQPDLVRDEEYIATVILRQVA